MKFKNTSNQQYIHGDFDNDGTPNIDDRYPFDRSKSGRVNPEVSLSNTIKYVESERAKARRLAVPFARKHNFDKVRVKDTYSTLNKLARKRLHTLPDFVGMRKVVHGKREDAKTKWRSFNNKVKVVKADNKYKTNKGTSNTYRAFHSDFVLGNRYRAEAQFVTKRYSMLNKKTHDTYKKGKKIGKKLKVESRNLIRLGF